LQASSNLLSGAAWDDNLGAAIASGASRGAAGYAGARAGSWAIGQAMAAAAQAQQPNSSQQVHGNSLSSPKPTWLYRLVERATGQTMKWGITNATNPQHRYTQQYYQDNNVRLVPAALGQRWHMYGLEHQLNTQQNCPWSVHGH
jgi:hypothetical protein